MSRADQGHERPEPPGAGMLANSILWLSVLVGIGNPFSAKLRADGAVRVKQRPWGQPMRCGDRRHESIHTVST